MAISCDWLEALAQPAMPAPLRWFDAVAADTGFRAGAPFVAQADPVKAPAPAPPPDPAESESDALALAFAEGEAAGRAAALAEAEQSRQHAHALRLAFRALDETALGVLAEELAATVKALCTQVMGDYAMDADALAERCKAAATRLGGGWKDAVLHLHPDDATGLAGAGDGGALDGWQVACDLALERGSLVIEAPDGAVCDGPAEWRRALAEALRA